MKTYVSHHWLSLLITIPFLLIKLFSTVIRLSDTNVYFYTAYQILQGKVLYSDIFFTNFPIFPYLSALYLFLTGESIFAYYFIASIEVAVTSIFIYSIIYTEWKNKIYAVTGQLLYLFSFIVLATSDHQSGVFAASLFGVLSYFFFQKKNLFLTGCFVALTILTKAYFLPLAVAYGVYYLIKERSSLLKFVSVVVITSALILGPFIVFAREGLISNVFEYSLTRSAGTSKMGVIQFFIFRDSLLFFLLITNIFIWRKYLFFSLFSIFSLLFLLIYKDVYYLYLNNVTPFLILSFPIYQHILAVKMGLQKMVIPSFVIIVLLFNLTVYLSQYRTLQKVDNFQKLVQKIEDARPEFIYGANDLTALLAYETETPMLNNTVDTNGNIFRKGLLNARELTHEALSQKTLVVVHGAYYPQYRVDDKVLDEIVIKDEILEKCTLIHSHPVYAEGIGNRVNLFQCYQ